MKRLIARRPSPAMVVATIALIVALGGTAIAAQHINGGAIKKQTIGGSKLKQKTLTGFQINVNKLGTVPTARRASHTYWVVVHNPSGPGNATLARASDEGISASEGNGAVTIAFSGDVSGCADVAGRNNAGTAPPGAGFAQTNTSPGSPNAIEVRTRDAKGDPEDADFHMIVICP
ncbi:MAG TPA: hypothetical protein VFN89_03025 [Solirubrobacterales bacterium]|nr:hypothetical protein [Solirubrobacterales bacterium]